jgi:hypothetical protein
MQPVPDRPSWQGQPKQGRRRATGAEAEDHAGEHSVWGTRRSRWRNNERLGAWTPGYPAVIELPDPVDSRRLRARAKGRHSFGPKWASARRTAVSGRTAPRPPLRLPMPSPRARGIRSGKHSSGGVGTAVTTFRRSPAYTTSRFRLPLTTPPGGPPFIRGLAGGDRAPR